MNHKKITVLLATFVLFSPLLMVTFGLLAGPASAAESGGFQYQLINGGTAVEITGFNSTFTSAAIPSVIAGKPVTSIGEGAFANCTALTTVTIPNSVIKIGAEAFQNCYSLTALTIPNSVTSIGVAAFYDVGLRTVVIPNSMTVIEDYLFFDCYSLTSVTIPVSITSIGDFSFGNCYLLTTVAIPSSVSDIGIGAFYNCGLRTVSIPESVSTIEDQCFQGCYALTSVAMPISITSIGDYSFYNCYALSSVTIPNNVSNLGHLVFGNCYNLVSALIPGSVTSIGASAFVNCYDLASIRFYGNAPTMGGEWAYGCGGNLTAYYYQGATGFAGSAWSGVALEVLTSPNAPQNLTAVAGDSSARLSWTVPSGFVGISSVNYLVYQDGTYIQRAAGNSVTIAGLVNGLSYNFTIVVPNTKGNLVNSSSVVVRLPNIGVAVDGTICDASGAAMGNATVSLDGFADITTSEYGLFVFTGVTAGNYTLTIAKEGYSTVTRNVTVVSSMNADLDDIVLNSTVSAAPVESGSMDLTLIIAGVAVAAAVAVYFLFFRGRKPKGKRKK